MIWIMKHPYPAQTDEMTRLLVRLHSLLLLWSCNSHQSLYQVMSSPWLAGQQSAGHSGVRM